MIHIATVHYQTEKWIDIQLKYLNKHIHEPFKVYAVLNNIDKIHFNKFYFATDFESAFANGDYNHSDKLDFLTKQIIKEGGDEDIIIFLDSDAFPIGNLMPSLKELIKKHQLIGVRVNKLIKDRPHRSFVATTIGVWEKIDGGWIGDVAQYNPHTVNNEPRRLNNVGNQLSKHNIDWYPIIRTNTKDIHPLFYGIYGDMIYHHGCGSRNQISTYDKMATINFGQNNLLNFLKLKWLILTNRHTTTPNATTFDLKKLKSFHNFEKKYLREKSWWKKRKQSIIKTNINISQNILAEIKNNEKFYKKFI